MVVQHNLQAMNANRMLGITTGKVAGSTEKLSSGYRINRAADDAAGLAISEKMRKQIRGLDQASSNAEDGISCVQTSEGALAEVQDMLQRMNELCVQAANGTNSVTDRRYIQDEVDQLITEIDRVAETTKFNDTYLLKGDKAKKPAQSYITDYIVTKERNIVPNSVTDALDYKTNYIGQSNIYMVKADVLAAGTHQRIDADVIRAGDDITDYMKKDVAAGNKPQAALDSSSYVAFVNVELNSIVQDGGNGQVAGDRLGGINKYTYDLSTDGIDDTIRANRDLYVFDTATETVTHLHAGDEMTKYLNDNRTMKDQYRLIDVLDSGTAKISGPYGVSNTSYRVSQSMLNGGNFAWTDYYLEISETKEKLYDSDGQEVSGVGLNKYFDEHGNYRGGLYTTSQARTRDEVFANKSAPGWVNVNAKFRGEAALIGDYITQNSNDVAGSLNLDLHVGADSDRENKIGVEISSLTAAGLGIDKLMSYNIGIVDETGNNATDAIDVVASALEAVSTQRSLLGAVQNRLEHTVKNLDNVVENTQAAESAIRDTDMADEMVEYSNSNVLMQAGQSMLAQANQANQGVLSLVQ